MTNTPEMTIGERNKLLVAGFYAKVCNARDLGAIKEFVAEDYIQHNPHIANGRAQLEVFLAPLLKSLPESRTTVVRLMADGDLVMAHVLFQRNPNDRGMAFVDIFRIADGKLAEHWDVKEDIPEETQNGNPVV